MSKAALAELFRVQQEQGFFGSPDRIVRVGRNIVAQGMIGEKFAAQAVGFGIYRPVVQLFLRPVKEVEHFRVA